MMQSVDASADVRLKMSEALAGLAAAATALGAIAAMIYDGRSIADARAISAEAAALKLILMPRDRVHGIACVVAAQFDLPVAAVLGDSRQREVVAARHAAIALADSRGIGASEIARALGRDRSSVKHALRRVTELRAADRQRDQMSS